ncbi:MAG: hypothetical protein AAFP70_19765 [Calditrichota bacterium]
MDERNYHVDVIDSEGRSESCEMEVRQNGDDCQIELFLRGQIYTGVAEDFFDALCVVRIHIEPDGFLLNCYGASKNVYPSRASRQMSSGRQAYQMTMGYPAERLVSIFDSGLDTQPATVDEQRRFYEDWLQSL